MQIGSHRIPKESSVLSKHLKLSSYISWQPLVAEYHKVLWVSNEPVNIVKSSCNISSSAIRSDISMANGSILQLTWDKDVHCCHQSSLH